MEGPRPPFESEFPKVLNFLDKSLRQEQNWSIDKEYPTALNLNNLNNIRVIIEDDAVVSHAVLKPMIVKTPTMLLRVGAIGSVVTDSAHRNKGLSRRILEDCLKSAERQGCDIAILWTNLYDFYGKLGFELAGGEISFVIEKEFTTENFDLTFMDSTKVGAEAILRLYNQHSVTTLRNADEIRKFLNIPQTQLYTAWDKNNNLVAYAVVGKGADLGGYVHEWGGGVSKLLSLFSYIRKTRNSAITIITPPHCKNLIEKMTALGFLRADGFLGMVKILNPAQFCAKVKKGARALGVDNLVFEKQGDEYYFGRPGQIFKTSSLTDITRLVFGPQKPTEIYPFDDETNKLISKVFPIQMWMWGWDSI